MKHEGCSVGRLNDRTTHGGYVITATGPTIMGIPATLIGDMTHCPQCNGIFPIVFDGVEAKHSGRSYAYHNDLTACGARLIASM